MRRAARIAVILTVPCLPALSAAGCPCRNGTRPIIKPAGRNELPGNVTPLAGPGRTVDADAVPRHVLRARSVKPRALHGHGKPPGEARARRRRRLRSSFSASLNRSEPLHRIRILPEEIDQQRSLGVRPGSIFVPFGCRTTRKSLTGQAGYRDTKKGDVGASPNYPPYALLEKVDIKVDEQSETQV